MRQNRRERLRREIAQLREAAFSARAWSRTDEVVALEIEKGAIVKGRVLADCAAIEEASALLLMHEWLSRDVQFNRLRYFGRIKKYALLYEALGHVTARHKMTLVKKIARPPKSVTSTVERMLALRDVVAHVFTLEDVANSLKYKGESVLTADGLENYMRDASAAVSWLIRRSGVLKR